MCNIFACTLYFITSEIVYKIYKNIYVYISQS